MKSGVRTRILSLSSFEPNSRFNLMILRCIILELLRSFFDYVVNSFFSSSSPCFGASRLFGWLMACLALSLIWLRKVSISFRLPPRPRLFSRCFRFSFLSNSQNIASVSTRPSLSKLTPWSKCDESVWLSILLGSLVLCYNGRETEAG